MKARTIRANLHDETSRIVRRVYVPYGTPFVLNLHDGRYYDLARWSDASYYVRKEPRHGK